MDHPEGTVSGVSVKLVIGWKGRLMKLKADMLRCFQVSSMELRYQSSGALDIIYQSPFVFFNAIPFPTC